MSNSNVPSGAKPVKPSLVPITQSQFIIDELMPTQEVHLIAGPSGAGKTTFLFQMLADIQKGEPIFGYPSHPVSIAYIACDRSLKGIHRTLARIGITPNFPVYSLFTSPEFANPGHQTPLGMLTQLKALHPDVQLIVIDAIGLLLDDSNGYGKTGAFITSMVRLVVANNQTILGTHHSPKQKSDSRYSAARQRLSGYSSWAGCASLIILVEPEEEGDVNNRDRRITVLPRENPEMFLNYTTDFDGRLVPFTAEPTKKKGELQKEFDLLFTKLPPGYVSLAILRGLLVEIGATERYGRTLIQKMIDSGGLVRIAHGGYEKS